MGRMLCGRKELNITISFIQQTFVKHIIYSRQWTFKDKYSCPQEFTVQRGGKQGSIQVEYNNTGEHHEYMNIFTSRNTDYCQKKTSWRAHAWGMPQFPP